MKATIAEAIAVTAELCQTDLSEGAIRIMVADLSTYPEAAVLDALRRCRREVKGRLSLAAIIERIDDGRPTAVEAYAMLPWTEAESAVLTEETLRAYGVCRMLMTTDRYGARKAFEDAYQREVLDARARCEPVKWVLSLGFDPQGRAPVLAEAIRQRKLTFGHADRMLSGEQRDAVIAILPAEIRPALPTPDPARLARVRALLADTPASMRQATRKHEPDVASTTPRDDHPGGPKPESIKRVRQMMIDLQRQQQEGESRQEGLV